MEEFVWRKPAILLYQNITSIDIVIITKQKHILVLKEERSLKSLADNIDSIDALFPSIRGNESLYEIVPSPRDKTQVGIW